MLRQELQIKKLHPDAVLPAYQKPGDAGFDLYCVEDVFVPCQRRVLLPTGLAVAVPEGYELQIRMRSGAALKTTLLVPNAPGTIDSGYRGEIKIMVMNTSTQIDHTVRRGERIAQAVLAPVAHADFVEVDELPESERGEGGFGSTGSN